nr:EOG090X018J [Sida crystallina]
MDMLNKLKSTVTTTVSQLSGVLPGNPVTREYEISKQIGSAGPDLLWKVFAGHKKSTKQEAAIFVLEKKLLDKYSKKDKDQIIDIYRKGVAQLTRLRHPQVLTVQHPLEESRESLAFASEPVFASLANILGVHENLPVPVPSQLKEYRLFDVEIKYGLQQLSEGLVFLHNDCKLLHGNLCPESIVVNQQGAWKIFGFDFCCSSQSSPEQDGKAVWPVREPDPELPSVAQPNLDYMVYQSFYLVYLRYSLTIKSLKISFLSLKKKSTRIGFSQKVRSLGCIISFFRHAKARPSLQKVDGIPTELVDHVRSLVQGTPERRPDAHQLIKSTWFEDVGVKTLNYLDSLFQWDNLQKSQFYKGLPQILPRLPHRVCLYRVMPCLAKEFVNPSMVPFVLPCALLIAADATKEHYVAHILPYLKPVMKIQEPVQILLIFMQKMELLLQKTPADDVKSDVLPMIYRALETESSAQIQELCLVRVPDFASLVDYPAMKNALMPRIKKLCINTNQLSVRVNCLLCIGKLLEHVDKWLVLDDVLPMLQSIPSKDPAIIMGILGIYKIALEHPRLGIPKEVIATQIVPFLFPLTVEPALSLSQFRALMQMVTDMMHRVEEEQKCKLQNVQALQDEQRSSLQMTLASVPGGSEQPMAATSSANSVHPGTSSSSSSVSNSVDAFSRLSMGATSSPSTLMDSAAPPTLSTMSTMSRPSHAAPPATMINWTTGPSASTAMSKSVSHDAVSSMIRSNLSAMAAPGPGGNNLNQHQMKPAPSMSQWPAGFQGQSGWSAMQPVVQQSSMAMASVPLFPQNQFHSMGMGHSPLMPSPATNVKPLARADIDDLLS